MGNRRSVERPLFGILGKPRVYVFELNRRLDAIGVRTAPRPRLLIIGHFASKEVP
ncbi:hypothetical protein [Novosphingobium sp.]|uniref:hypothetical protein n=1 Tax=Novosphingobium sp. TaxID=1874826 RepID=UPI0028AE27E0|nr:hypothetical protein [Novosphingobium sp.]